MKLFWNPAVWKPSEMPTAEPSNFTVSTFTGPDLRTTIAVEIALEFIRRNNGESYIPVMAVKLTDELLAELEK